jgi:L-ectoine synthase
MKVINIKDIKGTNREIFCPNGGFISNRFLLKSDNVGYSMSLTIIPKGDWQYWHYKNHFETCYCIKGRGVLIDLTNHKSHAIYPGIIYIANDNKPHKFKAIEDIELICVFNPPLQGVEVHNHDGSY